MFEMVKLVTFGFVLISILSQKSCSSEETTTIELTTEAKSIVVEKSVPTTNTLCIEDCRKTFGKFFICVEGKCICPPTFNFHDGNCLPKRSLNESCTSNLNCQHIDKSICNGLMCSCEAGFVQEKNNCIKSKIKQRGHQPNTIKEQNTITTNLDSEYPYKVLDFKTDLVLVCEVTGGNLVVTWLKDEEPIDKDSTRIEQKTTDKVNKLTIKRPVTESDAGNYTCKATVLSSKNNGTEVKEVIPVIVRPNLKLPPSSTAIEGEKMELVCSVVGRPIPNITWIYGNDTYDKSSDRIELLEDPLKKIPNAVLKIKEVRTEDHGMYTCMGINDYGNSTSSTTVRVKDKLAALWPFLGICAEVFVLCAIILIYEKKRNKTELEESDTDQSPEQKNTPEHGKDSVRQRK